MGFYTYVFTSMKEDPGAWGFGGRRPSADLLVRLVFLVWLEVVVSLLPRRDRFYD